MNAVPANNRVHILMQIVLQKDMNAVVSGNHVRILLQNNLKIVLQIPTRLFPEPRRYLPSVFNFIIFVPYHHGSHVNRTGIIVLNFKNVTTLFLIAVPS